MVLLANHMNTISRAKSRFFNEILTTSITSDVTLVSDVNYNQEFVYKITIPDFYRQVSSFRHGLNDGKFAYTKHIVQRGERPDQLSTQLYGTPVHYWTFFVVNRHLRMGDFFQWPLSQQGIEHLFSKRYSGKVITTFGVNNIKSNDNPLAPILLEKDGAYIEGKTSDHLLYESFSDRYEYNRNNLYSQFKIGDMIKGMTSGVIGRISFIRTKFGQMGISDLRYDQALTSERNFIDNETICLYDEKEDTVSLENSHQISFAEEHRYATYRYIDTSSPDREEIDHPFFIPTSHNVSPLSIAPYTFSDHIYRMNDILSSINVIKPDHINDFVKKYKEMTNL